MSRALIITDNNYLLNSFRETIKNTLLSNWKFEYACSSENFSKMNSDINSLSIKKTNPEYFKSFQLIISLHCKQLFPEWLVKSVRCINVHPGFNPYNRGWYPQIFSIMNGLPIGATIHEIDNEIDHGKIIAQKEIKPFSWDTSYTLYKRVLEAEIFLLEENLINLLNNSYKAFAPLSEGNLNLKIDFEKLEQFDLEQTLTGKEFLNYMRAMTHNGFKNLYFIDQETNKKVYIKIDLEPEVE